MMTSLLDGIEIDVRLPGRCTPDGSHSNVSRASGRSKLLFFRMRSAADRPAGGWRTEFTGVAMFWPWLHLFRTIF